MVAVDEQDAYWTEDAELVRFDELLRGHREVAHVAYAESLEPAPHCVRLLPEIVDQRRVDESHRPTLEVVGERLAEHQRHEAAVRADYHHRGGTQRAPERIVEPAQPEVQVFGALVMPHAQKLRMPEPPSDPLVHARDSVARKQHGRRRNICSRIRPTQCARSSRNSRPARLTAGRRKLVWSSLRDICRRAPAATMY